MTSKRILLNSVGDYARMEVQLAQQAMQALNGQAVLRGILGDDGWVSPFINSTLMQSYLWRDSRGRLRVDGQLRYDNGTPYVVVRVKMGYRNHGYERIVWASKHMPVDPKHVPINRRKREEMIDNMTTMCTMHMGDVLHKGGAK